jgi:hypothetical protein
MCHTLLALDQTPFHLPGCSIHQDLKSSRQMDEDSNDSLPSSQFCRSETEPVDCTVSHRETHLLHIDNADGLHDYRFSARDKALSLPEIIVLILLQLEPLDVIRAKAVSKIWHFTFQSYSEVRYAAVLRPIVRYTPWFHPYYLNVYPDGLKVHPVLRQHSTPGPTKCNRPPTEWIDLERIKRCGLDFITMPPILAAGLEADTMTNLRQSVISYQITCIHAPEGLRVSHILEVLEKWKAQDKCVIRCGLLLALHRNDGC